MRELCRTADRVTLSYLRALLGDAGIECVVLDETISGLFGGVIAPRIVVADEDWFMASRLLINDRIALDEIGDVNAGFAAKRLIFRDE